MLGDARLVAFIGTANAPRARRFYENTLGLRLVADSRFALVFDSNGVEIRIQKVESVTTPAGTALGWRVDDIEQAVSELTHRDVACERFSFMDQDDLGVWTSPDGARVVWFKDPDGNMLSLTEARSSEGA